MLDRRTFTKSLIASATLARPARPFDVAPSWDSIRQHQVPDWYRNAKFGIFIHWGLYSVPAWAVPSGTYGTIPKDKWFTYNAYAEWYLNSLRIKDSPTYEHHIETYGKDFDYYRFADDFNASTAKWDPSQWASLFKNTGARYAVLTSKHHDGFRLWPSTTQNPHRKSEEITAKRDLVGDLTAAVRSAGMKMGLYYSGGLDWTFTEKPIETFADLRGTAPQSEEYARYADSHWMELIDRYKPSVMWNDITYPKLGHIPELFAHYYNTVSEGVINNRFGVDFADFTTPEYSHYDKITPKKWESCRGLGYSFGYNRQEGPEQVIAPDQLVWLLVDIVSKNGNLLLNVGPRADGSIADIQVDRLHKLGKWLSVNGEGIFDTQPWTTAAPSGSGLPETRFTSKDDSLYAFLRDRPASQTLSVPGLIAAPGTRVRVLGQNVDSKWRQEGNSILIDASGANDKFTVGVRLTPQPKQAT